MNCEERKKRYKVEKRNVNSRHRMALLSGTVGGQACSGSAPDRSYEVWVKSDNALKSYNNLMFCPAGGAMSVSRHVQVCSVAGLDHT